MNLFERWSNKYIRKTVLAVLFTILIITMALMMLSAGLRCVDDNGCLKPYCKLDSLKDEYQTIIRKSMYNNPKCKFPL